jgi:hypothetical protein
VVPLVSPPTTWDVADDGYVRGAWAVPPTDGVTTYDVRGLPPSFGADHDTVTWALPGLTATPVGAAGADALGPVGTVVATGPPAPPLAAPPP